MSWGERGRNEYMTLGPFKFPHERDQACNDLCRTGGKGWHMHSSDVDRREGGYFAIMARYVDASEDA